MSAATAEQLIIIGAGGHARIVIDIAETLNWQIAGVVDLAYRGPGEQIFGYPVLGDKHILDRYSPHDSAVALAVGDGSIRKTLFLEMQERDFEVATLVHPTAHVSRRAQIGRGTLINTAAVINAGAQVAENCIINTAVILDHEVQVGKHSHIAPGVRIAGRVKIGALVFVGIGATIIDQISIGDNTVVGAGTVVLEDVPANSKVVGVPGRVLP